MSVPRDGAHAGAPAYACVKRNPFAASRSRLGVEKRVWPQMLKSR